MDIQGYLLQFGPKRWQGESVCGHVVEVQTSNQTLVISMNSLCVLASV